jgi:hypothetical protein
MTARHFIVTWFFFSSFSVTGQTVAEAYGNLILPGDLKENLSILASDALEGRETGTRGQKMAAAFIRHHFQQLGLQAPVNGSFFQPFQLYQNVPGETFLTVEGNRFDNFENIIYYGKDDSGGEVKVPVLFAGRGRLEDYTGLEVSGKGVLIMPAEEADFRAAITLAREKNVQAVFILNTRSAEEFKEYARQFYNFLSGGRLSLEKAEVSGKGTALFFVAPEVAGKMFQTTVEKLTAAADSKKKLSKKTAEAQISYKTTTVVNTIETENVLGYLEGTDKKNEVVVITSHYDHIGKEPEPEGDSINNGADDDGSGTVAVMQLAKAFAAAKKAGKGPRRSILFMTFTAEENGLLGSEYYTQNPVFPLDNTVVDLNIDMVGRRDEQHRDSPPYVYVIGADKLSSELHGLSESVNRQYTNLVFDYTYNDEDHPARLYYRSDHWNFAQKNIPIIFYFDGIHEDYHRPSDEVDKIEFDLLTLRTKAIFYTAWEIANREERIKPDAK